MNKSNLTYQIVLKATLLQVLEGKKENPVSMKVVEKSEREGTKQYRAKIIFKSARRKEICSS